MQLLTARESRTRRCQHCRLRLKVRGRGPQIGKGGRPVAPRPPGRPIHGRRRGVPDGGHVRRDTKHWRRARRRRHVWSEPRGRWTTLPMRRRRALIWRPPSRPGALKLPGPRRPLKARARRTVGGSRNLRRLLPAPTTTSRWSAAPAPPPGPPLSSLGALVAGGSAGARVAQLLACLALLLVV